jgi:hypothetical protein
MEVPAHATRHESDEFCIARFVTRVGLVNVGVVADLPAAKAYIKKLTARTAGEYVVYRQKDGRVIARAGPKSPRRKS